MLLSVEAMLLEGAFRVVGLVISFAVSALKDVWAWFSLFCRRSWGFYFVITFAAPS